MQTGSATSKGSCICHKNKGRGKRRGGGGDGLPLFHLYYSTALLKTAVKKDDFLYRHKTIRLILGQVFRERSSRKTVSYEEQIMSKDKYPSIFSAQMVTIVFIILQIFFATRAVLKIGEYSRLFSSFSRGIFGHVTCLGQSRVSKKI